MWDASQRRAVQDPLLCQRGRQCHPDVSSYVKVLAVHAVSPTSSSGKPASPACRPAAAHPLSVSSYQTLCESNKYLLSRLLMLLVKTSSGYKSKIWIVKACSVWMKIDSRLNITAHRLSFSAAEVGPFKKLLLWVQSPTGEHLLRSVSVWLTLDWQLLRSGGGPSCSLHGNMGSLFSSLCLFLLTVTVEWLTVAWRLPPPPTTSSMSVTEEPSIAGGSFSSFSACVRSPQVEMVSGCCQQIIYIFMCLSW